MKFIVVSVVFITVIAFMAGIVIIDIAVERYKRWRDKRDRRVPTYRVGAFTGVEDRPKRWGSP